MRTEFFFICPQSSALVTHFCHLITLSALASTFGGIVRPICLAALRLITNSNFVGCSTGRSAGLGPFQNFSTNVTARPCIFGKLSADVTRPPASPNFSGLYCGGGRVVCAP